MGILTIISLIIGALLAVVFFWLAVVWAVAQLGGWPKLAEKYPGRELQSPQCWSLQSAVFGRWMGYRGVLRACADSEALHFSVMFPFSLANAPLSIPWDEIHGKKKSRLFYTAVELRFQQAPDTPVEIRQTLADRLVEATGGAWHYEGE